MKCIEWIPDNVYYIVSEIGKNPECFLFPEEQVILSKFSEKRKNEFATGRIISKYLLECISIYNFPLLRGRLGEPIWPQGVTGSISHCDDMCFAAISKKRHFISLGVDIDSIDDIPENLIDAVCTVSEKQWIRSMQCRVNAYPYAKMFFSAKESAYKCIFPFIHDFIDFTEVEITFGTPAYSFRVKLVSSMIKFIPLSLLANIRGYIFINKKHIYTLATLAA